MARGSKTRRPSAAGRALLRGVDAVQLPVPDLEAGLSFYARALGQQLSWRTARAAGLSMGDSPSELVLSLDRPVEADLLVDSVDAARDRFVEAGGSVVLEPFDIDVGRAGVVRDPFGNELVLVDLSKGRYRTNDAGEVTGVG